MLVSSSAFGITPPKLVKPAAFRRVLGGVKGIGTPFDEEGEQAISIILEIEGFPLQEFAVRTLARAGPRTIKRDARLAQSHRESFEIAWVRGPTDQMWRGQLFEMSDLLLREPLDAVLFRIGRNNFQIAALAERQQSVTSATARMDTAERGAYAGNAAPRSRSHDPGRYIRVECDRAVKEPRWQTTLTVN